MSIISFLGSIPGAIANFVTGLINKSQSLWHTFQPEEQVALLQASTIVAIANQYVGQSPDFIWNLISQKFPNLTKDEVTAILSKGNDVLHNAQAATDSPDFETELQRLQSWLQALPTQNAWITGAKFAVQILVDLFMPGLTFFQKIGLVLEYVYHSLVKPSLPTPAPTK